MVSLNFLSRRLVLLSVFSIAFCKVFSQTSEPVSETNNLGYWAIGGMLAVLAAWLLGKKDGLEAQKLLKAQKKQLEQLRERNAELEAQLDDKNSALRLLEQKLAGTIALKDQALAESFSKDQCVAIVTQNMREPLREIQSSLQLLSNKLDDDELQDYLFEIENATNDLVLYINDILEQCKVEAGKVMFEEQKFNLRNLINTVRDQVEADSSFSVCITDIHIHPRIPVSLVGDTVRLRQILTNLFQCLFDLENLQEVKLYVAPQDLFLRNATMKFTFEGKCNIPPTEGESSAFIPDDLQLLKTTERLVRLQNGKMTFKQVSPGHLMIQLLLPFKLPGHVEMLEETRTIRKTKELSKFLSGFQILIAEDNKITQVVLAKVLSDRGAEVCMVSNGQEAVSQFEAKQFDLVIMDINMPVMDGYKAVSKIRRIEQGKNSRVPIIALTSSVLLTNKDKAMLHGMDEYVGKPFSIDDLLDKVTFLLTESQQA